jgi:Tfp pilus assembly protein FimT
VKDRIIPGTEGFHLADLLVIIVTLVVLTMVAWP